MTVSSMTMSSMTGFIDDRFEAEPGRRASHGSMVGTAVVQIVTISRYVLKYISLISGSLTHTTGRLPLGLWFPDYLLTCAMCIARTHTVHSMAQNAHCCCISRSSALTYQICCIMDINDHLLLIQMCTNIEFVPVVTQQIVGPVVCMG